MESEFDHSYVLLHASSASSTRSNGADFLSLLVEVFHEQSDKKIEIIDDWVSKSLHLR